MAAICNNAAIGVTLTTDNDLYEVKFSQFGSPPRSYVDGADLTFSVSGAAVQSGNSRPNRMQWSIASWGTREDAFTLDEMYRTWDALRAGGKVAVVGVTDTTFVKDMSVPITATAVFTAPPSFEQRSGDLFLISFGMTEI